MRRAAVPSVLAILALLVACRASPAADPAPADPDTAPADISERCAAALSQLTGQPTSAMRENSSSRTPSGWTVYLWLAGDGPWLCHTDAAGEILDLVFIGER